MATATIMERTRTTAQTAKDQSRLVVTAIRGQIIFHSKTFKQIAKYGFQMKESTIEGLMGVNRN